MQRTIHFPETNDHVVVEEITAPAGNSFIAHQYDDEGHVTFGYGVTLMEAIADLNENKMNNAASETETPCITQQQEGSQ